ncbi:MAG: transcription antitermination factor NusB [Thermoanaerobaculia bacterium]
MTLPGKSLSPRADAEGNLQGGAPERSIRSVRSEAVSIVERALGARAPVDVDLAAATAASAFDERDAALLREIVFGTLRWLKRLDHVLTTASGRTFEQIQPKLLPVLRVAIYQLLFLDRVPPHAIVHEAVDEAQKRSHKGAGGFVNAVLRRIAAKADLAAWPVEIADPVQRLAIETSHPEVLVERWIAAFGEPRTRALLEANNRQKPIHLLAFAARGGRDPLAERLRAEGIETEPSALSALGLIVRSGNALRSGAFARGEFYVQDEVAQLAALLPFPVAGERVLDAAAAPGGKGLALLAHEPSVHLVAGDLSFGRLMQLVENHRRLGLASGVVAANVERSPFTATFDRVIVDYPCSGTGTLRKHPELKWRWNGEGLERLAEQALRLLVGAASAVKPGGRLVAISCSLESEENEKVGERFLARDARFVRTASRGEFPPVANSARTGDGIWRWLPGDDHDGFTVQLFERRS